MSKKPDKPKKAGTKQVTRNTKGQFVKGKSGNPSGRPAETDSYRDLKNAAKEWLAREFSTVLAMHPLELDQAIRADAKEIAEKKQTTQTNLLQYAAKQYAKKAFVDLDLSYANFIFDRIVGKPARVLDVSDDLPDIKLVISKEEAEY